jgi:hypothetical protein
MRLGKIDFVNTTSYKILEDYYKKINPYLIRVLAKNYKTAIYFEVKPQKRLRLRQLIKAKIQNEMKGL